MLSQNHQETSLANVIGVLAEKHLEKKSPTKKASIKVADSANNGMSAQMTKRSTEAGVTLEVGSNYHSHKFNEVEVTEMSAETKVNDQLRTPKAMTPRIRRRVLERDLCCQFQDPVTQRQCKSTFALQVDHRQSQWAGGLHEYANLQVFCAAHNNFKYQKEARIRRS